MVRLVDKSPCVPGVVVSCSRELLRVRGMTPRVWPNCHSIGYDDPRILNHPWRGKTQAWAALLDVSFDLPVVPSPSTAPLTVELPSPPPIPSAPVPAFPPGLAGPSTPATSGFRDKGKGKAVEVSLEPQVGGSRKRKSPLISGTSGKPPKSAMKSQKRAKSTRIVKSKPIVESEDDEDTIIQVCGLVHFFSFSQFFAADFAWSSGGRPSPALHTCRRDASFASFTPLSQETILWPCFGKSFLFSGSDIHSDMLSADCRQSSGGSGKSVAGVWNQLLIYSHALTY